MPRFESGQGKEMLAKLSNELERQADIYKGLGVSKDAIMRLVTPRPDRLPKELIIPVVTLGTSVDIQRQADFAGIKAYYDLSRGHDIVGGITFGEPHLIWMQDGNKYLGKSVEWVLNHLQRNERPATQYDGVALAIVFPDFRKLLYNYAIDFPGTSIGSDSAPYLEGCDGKPDLGHYYVDVANPLYGSASCGS
jgi:hypothetical protein